MIIWFSPKPYAPCLKGDGADFPEGDMWNMQVVCNRTPHIPQAAFPIIKRQAIKTKKLN